MANSERRNYPLPMNSVSSLKSILKAYSVPIILFAVSLFFQLVVLPRSYPPTHYDVLGIPKYSSVEQVTQAYEKITSEWNSGSDIPETSHRIKVQYAFELLTHPLLKRDYDLYSIDDRAYLTENLNTPHNGSKSSKVDLPMITTPSFGPLDYEFNLISAENFSSLFEDDKAVLLQIISFGSDKCAKFSPDWKRIVNLLDSISNSGVVELGDVQLAGYLAEKKSNGQPFFSKELPAIVAFPPGCKSFNCLQRYDGFDFSVDAITDWFATRIMGVPRILYYTTDSMVNDFLVKSKPYKVKVIFFSKTGERATPFVRHAAKNYWSYASFAFTLWKEEESSFWWNLFGVESAPAVVFVKDPGLEPVVYHGYINSTVFIDIMEKNKRHALPQLRNITSTELGCDTHGYSRAGEDTKIWYCAIVAGRLSQELNSMRKTMRKVQEALSNDGEADLVDQDSKSTAAALALKQKRLAFAWLDGEAQQKYCFFHIHSESSFETCGPRRYITDVAQLFLVRYERGDITEEKTETKKKQDVNILQAWHHTEVDPVSTLVAKYNGSSEISEIIQWISKTIQDGDTQKIPPFRSKTPELLLEDADFWSPGSQKFFTSGQHFKDWTRSLFFRVYDRLNDPRIGPSLLLGALTSFGLIWLKRSKPNRSSNPSNTCETKENEDRLRRQRNRGRDSRNQLIPPSITDEEPKDAQQMHLSDSESE